MLNISEIRIENQVECITDQMNPRISFSLESDEESTFLREAVISVNDWKIKTSDQIDIAYEGKPLQPFVEYDVDIMVQDNHGCIANSKTSFRTGRMNIPWSAKWISDSSYQFENTESPIPFTFRKIIQCEKEIKRAYITSTALGIYELSINGQKVGNEYFAPGFTSYTNNLQYNYYVPMNLTKGSNEIIAVLGGGWAVGRSTYIYNTNKSFSKISATSPAFLMELYVEYIDGSKECFLTNESWEVTQNGNYQFGDFYDGELYDATVNLKKIVWKHATNFNPTIQPKILVRYGDPVTAHEKLVPCKSFRAKSGELIYDFGQNFAGVISLKVKGKQGQRVTIRHAEVLEHEELYIESLRTAKAITTYICREGTQEYSPRFTYMGFRYIGITGIDEACIEAISAVALYSDFEEIGDFKCSNKDLNQLQSNIKWSGKSNFVDIPTDCPQRDERQGWTGDIALFGSTACFNFNMSRFLDKWLLDLKKEQGRLGSIPFVIPKRGSKTPSLTTSCWGDSCIMVPWAEYLANGNLSLLRRQYPTMKRYMNDVKRWAGLFSIGETNRRIWKLPFHFGDWCAPYGNIGDWLGKGKWTGTAYWAYTCHLMSQITEVLGKPEESRKYKVLYKEICEAYEKVFMDGEGKLKEEFQTGYVLPLYFEMGNEKRRKVMVEHLWNLIKKNGVHLNTGFTATPYILFALADNGKLDEAYQLLLQDTSPSWIYQVRKGATTFWEQWDTIMPDGNLKSASMNHYAYGAVGDFFYRRICGLEAKRGGYQSFRIQPRIGGKLSWAECSHQSPYGRIHVKWEIIEEKFVVNFTVPVSTECELIMPSGYKEIFQSGTYQIKEEI